MSKRFRFTRQLVGLVTGCGLALLAVPGWGQTITVVPTCGAPGTSVWFDVTLDPQGHSIAGTQNDIVYDSTNTPIGECLVNDQLGKGLSWSFLPDGCSGTACTSIRAIVVSTDNSAPILSSAVLYRCRIDIPAGTPVNQYGLFNQNASATDPLTNFEEVTAVTGGIYVGDCSGGGC